MLFVELGDESADYLIVILEKELKESFFWIDYKTRKKSLIILNQIEL